MTNYSYWEHKRYFENLDLVIVGGGFTAYSTAIQFLKTRPKSRILILEPDSYGSLASSKNAGFLCFGSTAELLRNIEIYGEEQLRTLLLKQKKGKERMLSWFGAPAMEFKRTGGSELFLKNETRAFEKSKANLRLLNIMFKDIGISDMQFRTTSSNYSFNSNYYLGEIAINIESQIDSSKTLQAYRKYALNLGDVVLLPFLLDSFSQTNNAVALRLSNGLEFSAKKLVLATNSLTSRLHSDAQIEPARGLVLVTRPIKGLKMNRNYHQNSGYIYFRNHESRVIIGGARDIDKESERTNNVAHSKAVRDHLIKTLSEVILPGIKFNIEHEWVGFMGFTTEGKPLDNQIDNLVYFAAGLNGMGVALSNQLGYETANRLIKEW